MLATTALAQQIIDFFTPDDDDQQQITIAINQEDQFAGHEEEFLLPPLDELAPTLPYVPHLPDPLPDRYAVEVAHFEPETQQLEVIYVCRAGLDWGFMVMQRPIDETELASLPPMNVGASAEIEPVQIGSATGQYVQGMWQVHYDFAPGETVETMPATAEATATWRNDSPAFMLQWYADGMLYTIGSAMGTIDPPENTQCVLDKAEVLAIAESLVAYR
ncbi:MAG: hypothetical protein IPK19_12220 [Chloroflexi bacterium]|nr:hypothetical protein [Chloroflexota bacterium]